MIEKLTPLSILDENYCVCMIRNSSTIFVFWKFSNYYINLFEKKIISSEIRLKVYSSDRCIADIPVNYKVAGYHITLPSIVTEIKVGLFCYENGEEKNLCFSNQLSLSYEKESFEDYSFVQ
ncbi:MAG: DUF4912 domain-containing protein [Elusimicrobiales bacterium]